MSNSSVQYVVLFMVSAFVIIIVVDIILALDGRSGNTYSEIIRRAGARWKPLIFMLIFGMGLLTGHWFW